MICQSTNSIEITGDKVLVNRREVAIPDTIKEHLRTGNASATLLNGKIYLDGFEYLGHDQWKRSLKALFHKYF